VLDPLNTFAEENDIAILGVSHPPKFLASGKAVHAVTGSYAFVTAPRVALVCVKESEVRRLLLISASNIG
jgi:hypothetical protein